jgi:hypothetical protein
MRAHPLLLQNHAQTIDYEIAQTAGAAPAARSGAGA